MTSNHMYFVADSAYPNSFDWHAMIHLISECYGPVRTSGRKEGLDGQVITTTLEVSAADAEFLGLDKLGRLPKSIRRSLNAL